MNELGTELVDETIQALDLSVKVASGLTGAMVPVAQLQILKPIIRPVAVLVMNGLRRAQESAQVTGHNRPMFKHIPDIDVPLPITRPRASEESMRRFTQKRSQKPLLDPFPTFSLGAGLGAIDLV